MNKFCCLGHTQIIHCQYCVIKSLIVAQRNVYFTFLKQYDVSVHNTSHLYTYVRSVIDNSYNIKYFIVQLMHPVI